MRTIDKPAGLPVLAPADNPRADCLAARLIAEDPWRAKAGWPSGFTAGLAHRVDASTSGAILVADTVEELTYLRAWLGEGRFVRTYVLQTAGPVPFEAAACDLPLAWGREDRARMVVRTRSGLPHRGEWQPAVTRFRRLDVRRLVATVTTLAQHQIRAHAAHLGAPVLGDTLYGGEPLPDGSAGGVVPPGATFLLHHVGMVGPAGLKTDRVAAPAWCADVRPWPPAG